jgi:hypothetical protein
VARVSYGPFVYRTVFDQLGAWLAGLRA